MWLFGIFLLQFWRNWLDQSFFSTNLKSWTFSTFKMSKKDFAAVRMTFLPPVYQTHCGRYCHPSIIHLLLMKSSILNMKYYFIFFPPKWIVQCMLMIFHLLLKIVYCFAFHSSFFSLLISILDKWWRRDNTFGWTATFNYNSWCHHNHYATRYPSCSAHCTCAL